MIILITYERKGVGRLDPTRKHEIKALPERDVSSVQTDVMDVIVRLEEGGPAEIWDEAIVDGIYIRGNRLLKALEENGDG